MNEKSVSPTSNDQSWGGVEKLAQQRNAALAEVDRLRAALRILHPRAHVWRTPTDAEAEQIERALSGEPRLAHETSELQRALQIIDACGALSDWINRARPVITELMGAYERRVRSHPDFRPEDAAKRPWACMEYIAAEALLRDQPVAVVEISAQKA